MNGRICPNSLTFLSYIFAYGLIKQQRGGVLRSATQPAFLGEDKDNTDFRISVKIYIIEEPLYEKRSFDKIIAISVRIAY